MNLPWYVYALGASLIWGIHYVLIGKALEKLSIVTVLLLTGLPTLIVAALSYKTIIDDYNTLMRTNIIDQLPIWTIMLTSVSASLMLFVAIAGKNATLASLIEISYPIFVTMFAFLLLRENYLTVSAAIGGALILLGSYIVIYNNP